MIRKILILATVCMFACKAGDDTDADDTDTTEPVDTDIEDTDVEDTDVKEPQTQVSYVVSDHSTEDPLEGVTVTVGGQTYTTDAEGRFSLDWAPESRLEFTFEREGYLLHRNLSWTGTKAIDSTFAMVSGPPWLAWPPPSASRWIRPRPSGRWRRPGGKTGRPRAWG